MSQRGVVLRCPKGSVQACGLPCRRPLIAKAADGLKHAGGAEADYIADVQRLGQMTAAALTAR